jgi:hypothetical protein
MFVGVKRVLGEDNAALLGAMMITQIQLAAMNRAFMKEEERRDFFLYVDEFQNFATSSFIKILSEARKYRLALTLANQYIGQLEETIMTAIFGNVGSIISFVLGASDAEYLQKEFSGMYTQNDLVTLGKFEVVLKMSIDEMTTLPFPAKTLPLPALKNDNKEKIVRLSKERYGRKVEENTTASNLAHSEEALENATPLPPMNQQNEDRSHHSANSNYNNRPRTNGGQQRSNQSQHPQNRQQFEPRRNPNNGAQRNGNQYQGGAQRRPQNTNQNNNQNNSGSPLKKDGSHLPQEKSGNGNPNHTN